MSSNYIKCTINGVELQVEQGKTIIQAMTENSQKIAHYCWHPALSIAGVCRLCMVEVEGNPRVQIACNTMVTEGMKINNTSDKVKDAVKWGLDFHLINHPLDCPICDQAGECGLQDQYMEYGKYNPEMAEKKQKKHKVVDLGPTVVLDSERCILCSRCVRFTDEVTKTNELGIFNRGDHAEIGTHDGKKLDNKYSLNTVDICPVGALTSKDFRFKQRVWYLKDAESICNGCSTGCNTKVYYNKEGLFRVKPKFNADVNGHWMCDEGRNTYKFVNKESRLIKAQKYSQNNWQENLIPGVVTKQLASVLKTIKPEEIGLVLTGQNTVEEYESLLNTFVNVYKTKNIFHWMNNPENFETFDGLLIRGDKNPNTNGLKQVLDKNAIKSDWKKLEDSLKTSQIKYLFVFGPENLAVYPDLKKQLDLFTQAQNLTYFSTVKVPQLNQYNGVHQITLVPMKSYIEKEGTFVNYNNKAQTFKKVTTVVQEALTGVQISELLSGAEIQLNSGQVSGVLLNKDLSAHQTDLVNGRRADQVMLENRKKNEFVFNRGKL